MKRFKHNLSHYRLLTLDPGYLVPVGCVEVLPGDTFQGASAALLRTQPLVSPVMHPTQVRIHHFFCPNRLIWDDWEKFITGDDTVTMPTVDPSGFSAGQTDLADYFGNPPAQNTYTINALPFRAYAKIYNEFYRDQDLVTELSLTAMPALQKIAWEKDYFTTCRPWAEKGTAVTVPLGDSAPVRGIATIDGTAKTFSTPTNVDETPGVDTSYAGGWHTHSTSKVVVEEDPANSGYPGIYADLSQSTGIPVDTLREAFAMQRYQEARARYGSRYVEYLQYLGIRPSDARLQRPTYLGGGKQTISFTEVLATSEGTGFEIGDLKGHGLAAVKTRPYRRFFEEHGFVMSLMSVRPRAIYPEGLHRQFSRADMEDYWQKELESLGQQEVLNKEVRAHHATPTGVFGYNERYREYREHPSSVHKDFRSTFNYWHMGREFTSDPALNQSFVECDPTKRVYAYQSDDVLFAMVSNQIRARRMVRPRGLV